MLPQPTSHTFPSQDSDTNLHREVVPERTTSITCFTPALAQWAYLLPELRAAGETDQLTTWIPKKARF